MTSEEWVTLAKYSNPQEASLVRDMLESHGIDGVAFGGEINSTLWHLGPTIAGVELKVPAHQSVRAAELVETFREERSSIRPSNWTCPECGEEVDAGFEVCWFCESLIDETAIEQTPADESRRPVEEFTTKKDAATELADDEREPGESSEELAERAYKAAKLGIVFFPALIYSLSLLIRLGKEDLSETALKKYYWSTGIVLVWLIVFFALLLAP